MKIIQKEIEISLENHCRANKVSYLSIKRLIEAERTKKLLRRNAYIQQTIDKEIDNSIEDENRKNSN